MFNCNLLNAELAKNNVSNKKLAEHLKINPSTLYRKKLDGSFTREEINQIIVFLHIEDCRPIFFA